MTEHIPVIDSPGDILRLIILIVCLACLVMLAGRFMTRHGRWNPKTRDYWFAMVTWSLAGVFIGVQGLMEELPISPRTILVTMAALVTFNGLRRTGGWGDND